MAPGECSVREGSLYKQAGTEEQSMREVHTALRSLHRQHCTRCGLAQGVPFDHPTREAALVWREHLGKGPGTLLQGLEEASAMRKQSMQATTQ